MSIREGLVLGVLVEQKNNDNKASKRKSCNYHFSKCLDYKFYHQKDHGFYAKLQFFNTYEP